MKYKIKNLAIKYRGEQNFIAPSADVIGDVTLGDEASIWFQCVLRADKDSITIGDRSNIQDGSILHVDKGFPLYIGNDVTVGHKVMLHGCFIDDNSLVGMNATILNGAKIGKNCVIGAGSLITEGKQIPDNSLVMGVPGKVVKTVSDEQIQLLKESAKHYVENAQDFLNHLEED
jgi:carbonic anhydrase/acetyltransferase-like protein (isoleucine patch superfamily)